MKQFKIFLLVFVCQLFNFVQAQNAGDTITVKTFTFESTSRDTIIHFPTYNSSEIERVYMRYAMRCKDGLISPGISGQTNIGCGEWDYSCNTYITDSTRIDSLLASTSKYKVYPAPSVSNRYSTLPTFNITEKIQQHENLLNINSELSFGFNSGINSSNELISSTAFGGKIYMILSLSELNNSGLTSGIINALSLFNAGSPVELNNLKLAMKNVTFSDLSNINLSDLSGFQEVYFQDLNMSNGENKLFFHQNFNWTGSHSILIELSCKGASNNPLLDLQTTLTATTSILSAHDNNYGRFIEGSYVKIPNYKGISGANARTIEAWIKTTATNKNIAAWGVDAQGKRFTFRLNSDGRLRVEINGGSVIGTLPVNDDSWHHVAVVLNGSSLSNISFYVDGVLDPVGQLTNLQINTELSADVEISRGFFNRYWNGNIDDLRIWSAALNATTINKYRFQKIDNNHPNTNSLELNLLFEEPNTATINDYSQNGRHGVFMNYPAYGNTYGEDHSYEFIRRNERPNITLFRGDYNISFTQSTKNDTVPREPFLILESSLTPNPGTLISDISVSLYELWPDSTKYFNDQNIFQSQIITPSPITLIDQNISYYDRKPSKIEIMSFVTPYGINLDLGAEGKAWYFDVTDYLPILQGDKKISIERGGQWQEDMDIQFSYIFGTPVREVLDLRQIWKVDSRSYTTILDNTYFDPKTAICVPGTMQAKIRSAITGHGQEGEFIPRNHFIDINNGQSTFNWQVWKKCGENPVFPQGGTWIYDRAGWCPGMPTDVQEWNVTNNLNNGQLTIDYGISGASGTSNYIVNHQLVSYGASNFNTDARISAIISPTNYVEQERINPVCSQPKVLIQNTGTNPISSLKISYWINNESAIQYDWTGNMAFLEEAEISLPVPTNFWSTANISGSNTFNVRIETVNGSNDEYQLNNTKHSTFAISDVVPSDLIVKFKTNNASSESSYSLKDIDGNLLFQRSGMTNNTIYNDTFALTTGCYVLDVLDTGNDGISFWANSDGTGYLQLRSNFGQVIKTFEPDFGSSIHYEFTVTDDLGLEELKLNKLLNVYPNPTQNLITFTALGYKNAEWSVIDSFGRIINSGNTGSEHAWKHELNTEQYQSGIYLLQLIKDSGIQTATFIKQ